MKCSIYIRRLLSVQALGFWPGVLVMLACNYTSTLSVAVLSFVLAFLSLPVLAVRKSGEYISAHMLAVSALTLLAFSGEKILLSGRLGSDADTMLLFTTYLLCLMWARLCADEKIGCPLKLKHLLPGLGNKVETEKFVVKTSVYGYIFTLYLVVLLVYYAEGRPSSPETFHFLTCYFNQILILLMLVGEIVVELVMLDGLNKEKDFLPVLDNDMDIIGYVAAKESLRAGKKYLHPHVRIIVICNTKIYLQKSNDPDTLSDAAVDTPFSRDLRYGETLESCIDGMLAGFSAFPHRDVKSLLKTRFEDAAFRRIIYFHILNIDKEDEINNISDLKGTFWTPEQIEENLNYGIFSTCFEQEYEFLKNTVLLAYRYVNGEKRD